MTRRPTPPRGPRAGFTLIELLVVIAIIGVLIGLTGAAVQNVRTAAKRTQAVAEIAQIGNAVSAYKAKMNVGYIPAFQPGNTGSFMLKASYSSGEPEASYLKQVFPQMELGNNGLAAGTSIALNPNQLMVFFLTGGNCLDSTPTAKGGPKRNGYQGFSNNKAQPFLAPQVSGEPRGGPFLEVSGNKLDDPAADVGQYLDSWGTPYVYHAFDQTLNTYANGTFRGVTPYQAGSKFLNPKGFQIISAGANQKFGPGGTWTPGSGSYVAGGDGGDDLSNFNAGQLAAQQ